MARQKKSPTLQQYPRVEGSLLAKDELFPIMQPQMDIAIILECIDAAFRRCNLKKSGKIRSIANSPETLVKLCLKHLKTRSDPIISPYFVSQCDVEDLFELDAVSHEMQRHRMSIGVFYQYLLLELMRKRWYVFDGSREGDIIADIETPTFKPGLRLYMSVKKSKNTVGGQDVPGVIRRLESLAKEEKNLTSPYLCVVCDAISSDGYSYTYDRQIKCNEKGSPYSLNCEYWSSDFIFSYLTGKNALDVYLGCIKRIAKHLSPLTPVCREECVALLREKLLSFNLLNLTGTISPLRFLEFSCVKSGDVIPIAGKEYRIFPALSDFSTNEAICN